MFYLLSPLIPTIMLPLCLPNVGITVNVSEMRLPQVAEFCSLAYLFTAE